MFRIHFIVISVFVVFSDAVVDIKRDFEKILRTQSVQHFNFNYRRDNPSEPTRQFNFRFPEGTETLHAELGYVTLNDHKPLFTVYRYLKVPASDGNLYKVYVETNEAGKHWIIEVDPFVLGVWAGETSKPGADSNLEFKTLQSLVG